ncbi:MULTISPECIES: ArsR/SmtB family transcription factor [Microtetraspora]|uniref:Metalloregulator ArsR/SmtB family transcription factor n=1 Tax=Microtetraspora glauca TaxID=1996 RepID=A0ABV3GLG4_MICGL|nr:metalloregulator ArsR/SmtB family transcription factor [Microtetraspora sp. AC03309]MCC5581278.1 helix-turn-helix transcriptional regulator [Microtetraspora sp. AC03309]
MDAVTGLDACTTREPDDARVAATREHLVTPDEASRLADQFRLLGDPTRAQILYALLEAGELCVCDLATVVEVSDTAVSHALRLLRAARIVASRRAGRMIYYRLADAHVRMLLDLSREHLRHGTTGDREERRAGHA